MTVLVMAVILFFGFVGYKTLPVSDLPSVDFPTIEVSVGYPGANPEIMANAIAVPLERQFMTIEGIQSVFSSSSTGSSSIVLQFDLDRNIDDASTDVQAAITAATPQLPSDLPSNPTYRKTNPAALPILYFAVIAPNMTDGELYDYANTFIGQRLSMVNGVSEVITFGSPYAVRIQIDPEKLAAKNIGLDEVAAAIQNENVDITLGNLWGPNENFTIDADGQLMRASGYSEIIIKNEEGNLVKIRDIGRAFDSLQDDKYFMHYVTPESNRSCVILAVRRLPGKNTTDVVDEVNQTLDTIKPFLPASLEIHRIYDKSDSIRQGVADVEFTLLVALILVVGIIYAILGKALNTIIPSLALPMSIFGTFAIMQPLGFSIDILSLLALTLSIGFLVDDAIVVLENNVRHVQLGEAPFEASLRSSKEISITILSMTLCLAAAFTPMVFMEGIIGRLFREFAVTITVAIFFSGFIALTLTPMLASRFVKPYNKEKKTRMEKISDALNERMKNIYKICLHWAMNHRLTMLFFGSASIIFSVLLFKVVPMDFLPPDDVGFVQGFTTARDGTSPYLMSAYQNEATKIAIQDPNVESILSVASFGNPNQGILFLRMKPFKERLPMGPAISALSKELRAIPGINTYLSPLPLINLAVGTTVQAIYQYSLVSTDEKVLYDYADQFTTVLKENSHFSQVSSDLHITQPQWAFHIDREKASNFNVNAQQIEEYFSLAYSNNKISQINADINQYDVILETLPQFYRDPTVLSKLYVRSSANALVPLSEIVTPSETVAPLTVNHLNGLPAVSISFNPAPNMPLGTVLNALDELSLIDRPPQIHGRLIGTADIFRQSFANLVLLMILAIFVIYVVLGILYESFIHPITVMSALPATLFGGLFTLYIFNQALSLYSFVGLILLMGIVLKNGIMMVDFANVAIEKEKKSAYDAITEAALIRFRPILMTTVAAGMGAVPIALGIGGAMAQNRISLGLCIVGGLLVSQFFTLLLIPVIFYYFEVLQEKLFHFLEKRKMKSHQ